MIRALIGWHVLLWFSDRLEEAGPFPALHAGLVTDLYPRPSPQIP